MVLYSAFMMNKERIAISVSFRSYMVLYLTIAHGKYRIDRFPSPFGVMWFSTGRETIYTAYGRPFPSPFGVMWFSTIYMETDSLAQSLFPSPFGVMWFST